MQTLPYQNSHQPYHDEHLQVDLRQQRVILDDETVRLTPTQYGLLALLVQFAGAVVPRLTLVMRIWGNAELRPNVLDGHIHRLRNKLGVYAEHYIETVVGVGYRFRSSPRT
jgi:two-component system phosphate regulon response regulator PhoB